MIDYKLLKEIEDYAKMHMKSSKVEYAGRGQETEKVFHDCFNGKIAEYNLYFYLRKQNYVLKEPSLDILKSDEKSFDADLIVEDKHKLHVKSMSLDSIKKYGRSILFQKADPIVHSPSANNWIVAMEQIDLINYKVFKWLNPFEVEYGNPNNPLRTKCAIYL